MLTWVFFFFIDLGKGTTCYVFATEGTAIGCMSRLQKDVTLSITEVKYMVILEASKELIWLKSPYQSWAWIKKNVSYIVIPIMQFI